MNKRKVFEEEVTALLREINRYQISINDRLRSKIENFRRIPTGRRAKVQKDIEESVPELKRLIDGAKRSSQRIERERAQKKQKRHAQIIKEEQENFAQAELCAARERRYAQWLASAEEIITTLCESSHSRVSDFACFLRRSKLSSGLLSDQDLELLERLNQHCTKRDAEWNEFLEIAEEVATHNPERYERGLSLLRQTLESVLQVALKCTQQLPGLLPMVAEMKETITERNDLRKESGHLYFKELTTKLTLMWFFDEDTVSLDFEVRKAKGY